MYQVLLRRMCHISVFLFLLLAGLTAVMGRAEDVSYGARTTADDAADTKENGDAADERKLPSLKPGEWQPLFEMGENIYPSVVVSTATLKAGLWDDKTHIGDPWGMVGIVVRGAGKDCPVTVEIAGGNFVRPSVWNGTLPDEGAVYCVYPVLKYDYEKLLAVKQTVPETLSFTVTVRGRQDAERTVRVQVRPVNECVFNFTDATGEAHDVSYFFAAYVNENHPVINGIMKEAIASGKVDGFTGYSGDRESVKAEIEAIWDTLKARGVHYSTMTASADDDSPDIDSQYVRLLGESVNYAQANCVDGSVLMASIFRKIGLNVSLIELPEHMFLMVTLDEEGTDPVFIETTVLDSDSFDDAVEQGRAQYEENEQKFDSDKEEDQAYNVVNIQNARVMGIMPIKDAAAK